MKRVVFAATKPLPSYLVAFAVGPFEIVDAGPAGKNRIPVRIITPQGKAYQAKYAAEVTPTIIRQLEAYFGIPFPYDKADQVAIPLTVGFSAMENAGMVTYTQSAILADPALDSSQRQRRYAADAAHELAHQWFGDLVTPVWWNDIWLNEAFATWMERKILAEWKPQWNTRLTDLGSMFGAMDEDSLVSTRSVRQPIESENDISNAFDGITYQKGASVIRMFESWVGEKAFQAGVQSYLTRYRFSNATANDFLDAIAANGKPELTRAFSTFLDQPGFPEIAVQLKCDGAPRVALRQKRYAPAGSEGANPETWQVPVCVRYQTSRRPQQECFLLTQASAEFNLTKSTGCPAAISGNADASGYYETAYEPGMLRKLLGTQDTFLNAPERRTLLHDLDMLADAGDAKISQALAAVPVFAKAPERPIVTEAQGVAREVFQLVPPDLLPNYHRFIRASFGARAEALGWLPKRGDDDETRLLRAGLVPFAARYGDDSALQAEARRLADLWLRTRQGIDPDMLNPVLTTAAYAGDRALFDALLRALQDTQDRHLRIALIDGLSSFRDPALAQAAMQLVLQPDFDPRESLPLLSPAVDTPQLEKLPFAFVKAHYDELVRRMPAGGGSDARTRLLRVSRGFCDESSRRQFDDFFRERSKQFLGGPRAFAQTDESIRLCESRKAAQSAELVEFLRGQ
jgi:aminopeptidase N